MSAGSVAPGIRAAISQLLAEYCALLDHGQFEDVAGLFVAEGQLEIPAGTFIGQAKLERFFARSPRGIHLCGLAALTAADPEDQAIHAVSSFSFVELATGRQVVGYYDDDIVLAEGHYRFAVRRIEMHQVPRGA
jgi:hypothetical protein